MNAWINYIWIEKWISSWIHELIGEWKNEWINIVPIMHGSPKIREMKKEFLHLFISSRWSGKPRPSSLKYKWTIWRGFVKFIELMNNKLWSNMLNLLNTVMLFIIANIQLPIREDIKVLKPYLHCTAALCTLYNGFWSQNCIHQVFFYVIPESYNYF